LELPLTNHLEPSETNETESPAADPVVVANEVEPLAADRTPVVPAEATLPNKTALGAVIECEAEVAPMAKVYWSPEFGAGRVTVLAAVELNTKNPPESDAGKVLEAVTEVTDALCELTLMLANS
jgi:hypothetical protein